MRLLHSRKFTNMTTVQTYREAWDIWKVEQKDSVDAETERLMRLGYTGSVEDKMYRAGRYYFRKKDLSETKEKQEQAWLYIDKP